MKAKPESKVKAKAKPKKKGRGQNKRNAETFGVTLSGEPRMFVRQAYGIQEAKIVSVDRKKIPANRFKCLRKGWTVRQCRKAMEDAGFSGSARRWIRKQWQKDVIVLKLPK